MNTQETYFITFGQRYRYERHPKDARITPDGWVEVKASSSEEARLIAAAFFGDTYSFIYEKRSFDPSFYPKRCLFRLNGAGKEDQR